MKYVLAGDSTMATNPPETAPMAGWGQFLSEALEGAAVMNLAMNGRSTLSFQTEGRWEKLMENLEAGDRVLIQFGHNDSKKEDPTRYAEAGSDYAEHLRRFVRDVRSAGAEPVLITPVCRHQFRDGQREDTHGAYPQAVRQVAADTGTQLVDLEKMSAALLENLGEDATRSLFMCLPAGVYAHYPEGREDHTHFTFAGARLMAVLVAQAL